MSTDQEAKYYVYIMTNKRNGTLYTGVTNDLIRRVFEHRTDAIKGFTKGYQLHSLVYFGETGKVDSALNSEKRIKKWTRKRKLALIEDNNPDWKDLWEEISA